MELLTQVGLQANHQALANEHEAEEDQDYLKKCQYKAMSKGKEHPTQSLRIVVVGGLFSKDLLSQQSCQSVRCHQCPHLVEKEPHNLQARIAVQNWVVQESLNLQETSAGLRTKIVEMK